MGGTSLEIGRAVVTCLIFIFLLSLGRKNDLKRQDGWSWIIAGIGLIFFGTLMDLLDETYPSHPVQIFGVGLIVFLENAIGYLPGFALLSAGLWKWTPNAIELKRAQFELDMIYENALAGIVLTRDRRIVRINRVVEDIFGWSRNDFIGQSTEMCYPSKEDYEQLGESAYPVLVTGAPYQSERLMKRKDGSLIWLKISGRAVDGDIGRGVIWIIQNIEERRRADIALKESEERFRLLSESAFEGILIHQGGVILAANQAAIDLMDAGGANIIGSRVFDFIAPETHDLVRKNVQSGYDKPYEITGLRKNGVRIPIEVRGRSVMFQGQQARIVAIRDISERKKLEEETRKSSEFFRTLVEESPDIIATLGLGGEFLRVNKACAAMAGGNGPEALIGKKLSSIAVEGADVVRAAFTKATHGEPSTANFKTASAGNGGDLWWDARMIPLRDGSREVASVMIVARDMTEERMAAQALRKSEERYRNVINTTSEGFWAINENLETVEVNDSLLKTLGYTRDEMMKISILDLVEEENKEIVLERLTQIANTTHRRYEVTLRAKDGAFIPMVFNGTTVRDKDGHVIGAFSFITDVSEMKRVQDKLKKAKDAAENASRLKDKFVSLVSHDIKSPMISMLALLDVLRSGGMGSLLPQQAEMLSRAATSCEGLIAMTDRLLDLGRLQSGKLALDRRFTDLGHLVSWAFDGSRIAAAAKGIALVNFIPSGTLVFVDREIMISVLGNLISNAVKFSHAGGTVEVGVERSGGVTVSVRDHGVGMTREESRQIFWPEGKPARTGTAGERGTGLGLILCSEMARAHGGRIWAESEPGKGSVFFLEIPKITPTVLLMDSDPDFRKKLAAILLADGLAVMEAGTEGAARKIIETTAPHLVITGFAPDQDGAFSLVRWLRKNRDTEDIPALALVVDEAGFSSDNAMRLGANGFINRGKAEELLSLETGRSLGMAR